MAARAIIFMNGSDPYTYNRQFQKSTSSCRCDRAAATLLLTTAGTIDVMGGVGFVDISLVEDPAVERGGSGACGTGKGRNDGKRGETVFWGNMKPVVVCGVT
eukprot:scaffold52827_cov55-Attheya_sp.AAC.1